MQVRVVLSTYTYEENEGVLKIKQRVKKLKNSVLW